jgi:hypothetical protein
MIMVAINSQWGIMLKTAGDSESKMAVEKAAYLTTFYLINGPGHPANWNSSNVTIIGLANNLNVIDQRKFIELMKIDNNSLPAMLGIPEFKIFINLTEADDGTINSTGLWPVIPNTSAVIMSYVSFNNTLSKLYVTVWK